uniref:RRN3 homolog, RNA polymerase I transcription factor n=1 Tax=Astyanax mexicanus TaxID=7994 RepID=A0A8B9KB98_ASTMX
NMEVERDFMNSPPMKTVRFGSSVINTLAKVKQECTGEYDSLSHSPSLLLFQDAQIVNWLQEFRSCVTMLGKEHEQLIYSVLRLPWLGRSPAVVDEYLAFLGNLISAQTVYLRPCLRMLVSNFTPKRIKIQEGNVDISDSDDDDENLPRIFDQCHQALQMIARYAPSTSRFLMPILSENFPFVQKSSRSLECYVHNLLRIAVYIPTLRRDVLELIISKMLTLDVSAPRSEIEDVESSGQENQSGDDFLFDMDDDEDSPLKSSQSVDGKPMLHPIAERLDTLMSVLLAFIKDMCHVNVLNNSHLPSQPPVLRQAAAGYMGSFLARAKFLPIPTVRACLDLLVPWLHLYIDSQDSGSKAFCDVSLHGPFYSTCQAVFYTLIFRHKAMVEGNMKKGLAYLQSLNLERIVMCQLNPLKVCLPAVTNMFAAITRKYQLVFCYTIIERNNRQQLPIIRSSVGGDSLSTNTNPLDTFFPFDPYLLKRSGKLFESIYQVWEEPSDCMVDVARKVDRKVKPFTYDEDDFLQSETPRSDVMMGVTPGSYDSHLRSPSSVGSPPIAFLQRPF